MYFINKKGLFYKVYSTCLNKLVYVYCVFDWPALSSTRWWRVTVTSGRPAGVGPTRSAVPSIRASSPRRRTGTSKPASSQHYRYICVHNLWWLESVFSSIVVVLTTLCLHIFTFVQVFLTSSSNVFLLEPCQDVPKLLENQVEVCKGVLSIYRHMIMEHSMNTQTWLVVCLDVQIFLKVFVILIPFKNWIQLTLL